MSARANPPGGDRARRRWAAAEPAETGDGARGRPNTGADAPEAAYAPVKLGADGLGGPELDAVDEPGADAEGVGAPGDDDPARERPPARVPGPSAASVRASMRANDPWRRPSPDAGSRRPAVPPRARRLGARILASVVVVAALVGVLLIAEPLHLGGGAPAGDARDRGDALNAARARASRLEAALRRESEQRYAWEMWAREFDRSRYRAVKRQAARRAERRANTTDSGS